MGFVQCAGHCKLRWLYADQCLMENRWTIFVQVYPRFVGKRQLGRLKNRRLTSAQKISKLTLILNTNCHRFVAIIHMNWQLISNTWTFRTQTSSPNNGRRCCSRLSIQCKWRTCNMLFIDENIDGMEPDRVRSKRVSNWSSDAALWFNPKCKFKKFKTLTYVQFVSTRI